MQGRDGNRLILVSNRLPYKLLEKGNNVTLKQSDGGLVTALVSFIERDQGRFSEKWWIGSADFSEKRWNKYIDNKPPGEHADFNIDPVFLPARLYDRYYNGFCNTLIWPLFHYFTTYVIYDEEQFKAYEEVNRIFADRLASLLQPGDILWIHDYHHFLLPGMIRQRVPDALIGFFLHIPFPTYEIFRMIHGQWKEKIITGMLGADLIGFHTHEYVQHFLKTVRMVSGHDHQYRSIAVEDRIVNVDIFPLGIDYDKFHGAVSNPKVIRRKETIRKNFGDKKIIFSVDRLDYTKGITHRLAGFTRFLERYPEWHGKVVFIMVIVPSRDIILEYNERKKMIEEQVGRLNGMYSTLQWQPVIYRYNHVPFDELCALYNVADVGLITPLRDGMNLVAKEFIASREKKGVLILSELAGAASELGEALLVNPTDSNEIATAIEQALLMPAEEQEAKIVQMQKRLSDYNVVNWVNDFLTQLSQVKESQMEQTQKFVQERTAQEIASQFKNAATRHLFLDYDGTLVPFARRPQEATPDKNLLDLLQLLSADSRTQVTIISGRDSNILEEWFDDLPINLVAEHGASVRLAGKAWEHAVESQDDSWKEFVRPSLEMFVRRSPGSFIEDKSHTLAWHYRNVDPDLGFVRSRELLDSLLHLIRNARLQVIDGNKVIEVRITGIDKGSAAQRLTKLIPAEFVMVIGDDTTDEDMFSQLNGEALTIKVGPGHTAAEYMIPSQREVLRLLNKLVKE